MLVNGALLAAFALSLASASRQFEHALIAQRQAALVEGLARDIDTMPRATLRQSLSAYRGLVNEERRYLPGGAANPAEVQRADALARMAEATADRAPLAALVRQIANAEANEVDEARDALDSTRRDTMVLGCALAAAALAATGIGAWQLHRANRDLAAEVAARTAELRGVDQSRRLFFAKVSHELRTPVTAIRAIAEVAEPQAAAGALADIVAQAGFLGHRIEEMLALAKAAEGRPSLSLMPVDLRGVMADAAAQAAPFARSVEVEIGQSAPAEPVLVLADARWLAQAMVAVLDNALKFSDPGASVDLALSAAQTAVLRIADSGPGVLPRELPRLFDAYYQAEAGRMRGGSGLGLALARWVVESHGGTIHAENREDGGCCMVIELPLAEGA